MTKKVISTQWPKTTSQNQDAKAGSGEEGARKKDALKGSEFTRKQRC